MARFSRMHVLNAMYEISLVPVFYHSDLGTAKSVVTAINRAGCQDGDGQRLERDRMGRGGIFTGAHV